MAYDSEITRGLLKMISFSTYFSPVFFILLCVLVIIYNCVSVRLRRWVMLIFSYIVFYAISGKLVLYLIFSTLSVHHIGLWIASVQNEAYEQLKSAEKENKKIIKDKYKNKQLGVMAFAVILHIGILAVLKYTPFAVNNINNVFTLFGSSFSIEVPNFLVPIGISFYTLQAVSYLFDVYRRKIPADKNIMRLAMFMSFFPQIMEGPICRYTETAESLWQADRTSYRNLIAGFQRILFGVMKKLVIADRLNLLIKNVFLEYEKYDGFVIALSAVFYTIQLYMDFSGTMDVVIGCAQIFGVNLPENFKRPFFSTSISEFWKRWHITLGAWFKDYIFLPVSMAKPMKKLTLRARKILGNRFGPLIAGGISLFCVWLCNGIWHGAGWKYIFFGMYHFALILLGSIMEPFTFKITQKLHINRDHLLYRCIQIVRTCILVCIGELFFRSHGLWAGLKMFRRIFTDFSLSSIKDGSLFTFGMDKQDFFIIGIAVLLIFIIGILQEKGIRIRNSISKRHITVQFAICYALIMFIIIFGAYGPGYVPLDPIYAGF